MELLLVSAICLAAGFFLFRQMWLKMKAKSACDCCSKKEAGCSCSLGDESFSPNKGGDGHGQKDSKTNAPR